MEKEKHKSDLYKEKQKHEVKLFDIEKEIYETSEQLDVILTLHFLNNEGAEIFGFIYYILSYREKRDEFIKNRNDFSNISKNFIASLLGLIKRTYKKTPSDEIESDLFFQKADDYEKEMKKQEEKFIG